MISKKIFSLIAFLLVVLSLQAQKDKREFYEIKTYTLKSQAQEATVEAFLKNAYLPALHQLGIKNIGVFKPVKSDTTFGKRIVVLIPYRSLEQFAALPDHLEADKNFNANGKEYLDAVYTNPPYGRIESVLLRAFVDMKKMEPSPLTNARSERVYELRSYEGVTEKIFKNKVHMFNQGGEIPFFKKLGFNAVFYGEVISGRRMPNLMYMTTFADQASHDEHWKSFINDPFWKKLSSMPEYQHNVSKINIYLLQPTEYSDY